MQQNLVLCRTAYADSYLIAAPSLSITSGARCPRARAHARRRDGRGAQPRARDARRRMRFRRSPSCPAPISSFAWVGPCRRSPSSRSATSSTRRRPARRGRLARHARPRRAQRVAAAPARLRRLRRAGRPASSTASSRRTPGSSRELPSTTRSRDGRPLVGGARSQGRQVPADGDDAGRSLAELRPSSSSTGLWGWARARTDTRGRRRRRRAARPPAGREPPRTRAAHGCWRTPGSPRRWRARPRSCPRRSERRCGQGAPAEQPDRRAPPRGPRRSAGRAVPRAVGNSSPAADRRPHDLGGRPAAQRAVVYQAVAEDPARHGLELGLAPLLGGLDAGARNPVATE